MANHGNKGRPFRLALPRADYCDNSAERKLLTPVKRAEGLLNKIPQLNFLYIS